jgi:hypothetical protein
MIKMGEQKEGNCEATVTNQAFKNHPALDENW